MVLREGLDISSLPKIFKENFNQLDRLEGQYRVTSYLIEIFDLEELSPRKGPPCGFCNEKEVAKMVKKFVWHELVTTVSKVIQSG